LLIHTFGTLERCGHANLRSGGLYIERLIRRFVVLIVVAKGEQGVVDEDVLKSRCRTAAALTVIKR
jgi:hypothetical protein